MTAPALLLGPAWGQGLPREKDLRIFVGFEQGGGADSVARAIAVQRAERSAPLPGHVANLLATNESVTVRQLRDELDRILKNP